MLRSQGSFGVCRPLLKTFYETVVADVVSCTGLLGRGCSEWDKKALNRLKRASSVWIPIEVIGERWSLVKLSRKLDTSHPLYQTVGALSSSFRKRLRHPRWKKEGFRTTAISLNLCTFKWVRLCS